MSKDEYIIINRTAIQKRIEELEEIGGVICSHLIRELKQILSQSTPLIPEIEAALGAGLEVGDITHNSELLKEYYIANLKLNI